MSVSPESKVTEKKNDEKYMRMALKEAEKANQSGEVPVGAVLVKGNRVLAKDHNRCVELHDPTAHAEILVLRRGGETLKNYRLNDTMLYVTTEPCPMCASAMIYGRVSRLVFGAPEPKFGAVESKMRLFEDHAFNHHVAVDHGVLEKECIEKIKTFFKKKRERTRKSRAERRPGNIVKENSGF
ncbi:MAG: tRNA adenosine(34) deaminase TadA [Deltaproteobacteria bacterium]